MYPFDQELSADAGAALRESCKLTDLMISGWPVVINPMMLQGVTVAIGGTHPASVTRDDEIHMSQATYTSMAIVGNWNQVEQLVKNVQQHLEAKRRREKEGGA